MYQGKVTQILRLLRWSAYFFQVIQSARLIRARVECFAWVWLGLGRRPLMIYTPKNTKNAIKKS